MPTLATLREDYAKEAFELHRIFEEAGPDLDMDRVKRLEGTSEEKAAEIKRRNDVLSDIAKEIEGLEHLQNIGKLAGLRHQQASEVPSRPTFNGSGPLPDNGGSVLRSKGLELFLRNHKGYQAFRDGRLGSVGIELPVREFKTLITLTTISPQNERMGLVNMPLEERSILDDLAQGATDRPIVEFYEETTVTNSATMVAEGAAKPESALAWTLRTEPIYKAATWIPATREALDDVAFLQSQISNRLRYMVGRVEEAQVINGNGTPPNLRGLLNRSPQSEAVGAGSAIDAIYRGMQKIRGSAGTGFAEPTALWIHPVNWTPIKLATETGGRYLYGGPAQEPGDSIWGLPVHQTTAMPTGTALIVSRSYAEVIRREAINVTLSTEHASYFTENKVAILAESRLGLAVFRPSAFCAITGLA